MYCMQYLRTLLIKFKLKEKESANDLLSVIAKEPLDRSHFNPDPCLFPAWFSQTHTSRIPIPTATLAYWQLQYQHYTRSPMALIFCFPQFLNQYLVRQINASLKKKNFKKTYMHFIEIP